MQMSISHSYDSGLSRNIVVMYVSYRNQFQIFRDQTKDMYMTFSAH